MNNHSNVIAPYASTVIKDLKDMLNISRKQFADRTAFLTKPVKEQPYVPVTYRQYADDVDAFGTALLNDLHLDENTATGIIGESRYEWYVSYLAIVNGASVVVPLDKELPPHELANLLCRSHIDALIISPSYFQKLHDALQIIAEKKLDGLRLKHIISMGDAAEAAMFAPARYDLHTFNALLAAGKTELANGNRSFVDYVIDPNRMRILLFTSGTTAAAKAVMHSHATVATNLMAMCKMVYIAKEDVFFSVLPLHHTYECTCGFLCPIYRGSCIAQCEGLRYILANLKEARATVMLVVPLIAETFYKKINKGIRVNKMTLAKVNFALTVTKALRKVGVDKRRDFFKPILDQFGGALRLLIIGGAKVKPEIIDALNAFGLLTLQGYGLTECAPIIALNCDKNPKSSSAGQALPGVEIEVANPDENGIGEFIARGKNVMLGYYNDPAATAAAIDKDGFFHTGDLGYIDSENFVIITGRKKNVIVTTNGKNIYPEEIEGLLADSPLIQEVVVSGSLNQKGETVITAEIFPDLEEVKAALNVAKAEMPDQAAMQHLLEQTVHEINHRLPTYKAVRQVVLRDTEFPKNTSKKIKR
ncbi:AMP-binding protein [Mageeibacillus indolicus]|uniref:AMP-binding enzyme n=2 Tax=Mageeibacillus indolicus TaxID=884684 RepID=D3R0M2_MAGIU|nr:AMP-binding protein [Mageeibacillus indolicus]ADC90755.1 AMP-binding enzyme [Mageeibacillus indolicus UPII9-5]PNH18744.1 hypothetical protein B7R76_04090 [Mageeibacillus indolicus]